METSHAARSVRAQISERRSGQAGQGDDTGLAAAAEPTLAPSANQPRSATTLAADRLATDRVATDRVATGRIAEVLAERLGVARFERYFGAHPELRLGPLGLEVPVTSGFLAALLDRRYKNLVLDAATDATGAAPADVKFIVSQAAPVEQPASGAGAAALSRAGASRQRGPAHRPDPQGGGQAARGAAAQDQFDLARFITGAANRLAYEAALQLVLDGPESLRSPVFIHGPCGVGKTHLLAGLAQRFQQAHPGASCRRITGDQFTSDYINAVRGGRVESFRRTYRGLELLCIDDVGSLAGRGSTQQELVYTIDAIAARRARVCVVGAAVPRALSGLSDALSSRLMAGMVARIDAPEVGLRERLAAASALRRGLVLDDGCAAALAQALPDGSSVREIEGLILKIEAIHRLIDGVTGAGARVGMGALRRALGGDGPGGGVGGGQQGAAGPLREHAGPMGGPQQIGGGGDRGGTGVRGGGAAPPVRFQMILSTVCRQVGVQESEVLASGRHALIVLARSMSAWVARQVTTMSFPEIARALQRPNHSTVITACQRIQRQIAAGERVALGQQRGEIGLSELGDLLVRAVRAG